LKVVLDTNIFISALLTSGGSAEHLYFYWQEGRFDLFTSRAQLSELRRVSRYPKLKERLRPSQVGALINLLKDDATLVIPKRIPNDSPDPDDNLILAIALESRADYLVSLNMIDVVRLKKVQGVKIIHPKKFLGQLEGQSKHNKNS
jgi:uncharacterized protein